MENRKMPPLGPGSIDVHALHTADARGTDLEKAIDKARVPVEQNKPDPKEVSEAAQREAEQAEAEQAPDKTSRTAKDGKSGE